MLGCQVALRDWPIQNTGPSSRRYLANIKEPAARRRQSWAVSKAGAREKMESQRKPSKGRVTLQTVCRQQKQAKHEFTPPSKNLGACEKARSTGADGAAHHDGLPIN